MTNYNLQKDTIDWDYLAYDLTGNEKTLNEYYKEQNIEVPEFLLEKLKYYEELPFLSKQLYYSNAKAD